MKVKAWFLHQPCEALFKRFKRVFFKFNPKALSEMNQIWIDSRIQRFEISAQAKISGSRKLLRPKPLESVPQFFCLIFFCPSPSLSNKAGWAYRSKRLRDKFIYSFDTVLTHKMFSRTLLISLLEMIFVRCFPLKTVEILLASCVPLKKVWSTAARSAMTSCLSLKSVRSM